MKKTINERVKELRETLNLSQADFCGKIDTNIATLSRIENGLNEPSVKTINKILTVFDFVSNEWLSKGTGAKFINGTIDENITKAKTSGHGNNSLAQNPWKDAFVVELKEKNTFLEKQVEWMQSLINNLTQKGANASFNLASDVAEFPFYLLKGDYSGASAQA